MTATPPTSKATPTPEVAPPTPAASSTQPKKAKAEKAKKGGGGGETAAPVDVSRLDMRVGRIVKAWKHPDADGLYVEEGRGGWGETWVCA